MKINREPSASGSSPVQHPIPMSHDREREGSDDPFVGAVRSTFRDPQPAPEPVANLETAIRRLEANQRTPGTIEIGRRVLWFVMIALVVSVTLGAIALIGLLTNQHHASGTPAVHALAEPSTMATTPTPPTPMSDQQLAAALNAICTRHRGACVGQPVTAANLRTVFLPYVCWAVAQTDPPQPAPGTNARAWQAAWAEIGPLVVSSGQCSA